MWFAHTPPVVDERLAARLLTRGAHVETRRAVHVASDGDGIRIEVDRGPGIWRRAMFYHLGCAPVGGFASALGVALNERHGIEVERHQ